MQTSLSRWVAVRDGEDFVSLMQRWSECLAVPPRYLNERLGLQPQAGHVYGVTLTSAQTESLAQNLRVATATVERTLLSSYERSGVLHFRETGLHGRSAVGADARREWATIRTSSVCPLCVKQFGYWRLCWRLSSTFVCTVHGVGLVDRCAGCGFRFRSRSRRNGEATSVVPSATRCMNRIDRRVCGTPMAVAPFVAADTEQLSAQTAIDGVIASGGGVVFGEDVCAREWFQCLRLVASLTRRVSPGQSCTPGVGRHPASAMRKPASCAEAALMLPPSVAVMDYDSVDGFVDLVDRSIRLDRTRANRPWRPRLHAIPARLDELWSERLLAAARRPFGIRYSQRAVAFDPCQLPGTLPPAQMARFGNLLDSVHGDRRAVFAAVLVARVGADLSWSGAWQALGYPDRFCEAWTRALGPRRHSTARAATQVAAKIAADVSDWIQTDHGVAREALARFTTGVGLWRNLARRHGLRPSGRQHHAAGMWVYQQLTGNHFVLSPLSLQLQQTGISARQLRKAYGGLDRIVSQRPQLANDLRSLGRCSVDRLNAKRAMADMERKAEGGHGGNSVHIS